MISRIVLEVCIQYFEMLYSEFNVTMQRNLLYFHFVIWLSNTDDIYIMWTQNTWQPHDLSRSYLYIIPLLLESIICSPQWLNLHCIIKCNRVILCLCKSTYRTICAKYQGSDYRIQYPIYRISCLYAVFAFEMSDFNL